MQIRKCSGGTDHVIPTELIREFRIRRVVEPVCDRGDNGYGGRLSRARYCPCRKRIGLVEDARALLKGVPQAGGYMWAQTVLEIQSHILIRFITSARALIERETWTVGQHRM
jgi:hypothetical protein